MKKLLLIAFAFFATPAMADDTIGLKYEAYWAGLNVGEASGHFTDTPDSYNYNVRLDAMGLVRSFTNYWSESTITGKKLDGKYLPEVYDTHWQTKKQGIQRVVVTYSEGGNKVEEVATPPENRGKRPLVDIKDKKNTVDPISAGFSARDKIKAIAAAGVFPQSFKVPIFDSRRVFEMNITVLGYENKKIDGKKLRLLHVNINRTIIAGFNAKELAKAKQEDPNMDIYIGEDMIPVFATAKAPIGTATVTLVSRCSGTDCKL